MKEFKGTKGEWSINKITSFAVMDADGNTVATTGNNAQRSDDECIANANLIAAAPDLLEALQGAIDALRTGDKEDVYHAIVASEAAVNKALNIQP